MRGLYNHDVWIPSPEAAMLADTLKRFSKCDRYQAHLAWERRDPKFGLYPKLHLLDETYMEMKRQSELAEWVLNPVVETCSLDEDFVGRCAVLTRSVSPRLCAKRSLERYKAQIYLAWRR